MPEGISRKEGKSQLAENQEEPVPRGGQVPMGAGLEVYRVGGGCPQGQYQLGVLRPVGIVPKELHGKGHQELGKPVASEGGTQVQPGECQAQCMAQPASRLAEGQAGPQLGWLAAADPKKPRGRETGQQMGRVQGQLGEEVAGIHGASWRCASMLDKQLGHQVRAEGGREQEVRQLGRAEPGEGSSPNEIRN